MRSLLLALLFTTACATDKHPPAKIDPASTSTTTSTPTSSQTPSEHRAADDKATEDLQAKNAASADADKAEATSEAKLAKAHGETTALLQQNFDAADRRFNEAKAKAAKATGAAKKRADTAIADAKKHEASVMAGIAKLRDASLSGWDATKTKVDADAVALNGAIDSLEIALK